MISNPNGQTSHFATVFKIILKRRRDIKEYFKTLSIFINLEEKQVLVNQNFSLLKSYMTSRYWKIIGNRISIISKGSNSCSTAC